MNATITLSPLFVTVFDYSFVCIMLASLVITIWVLIDTYKDLSVLSKEENRIILKTSWKYLRRGRRADAAIEIISIIDITFLIFVGVTAGFASRKVESINTYELIINIVFVIVIAMLGATTAIRRLARGKLH